MILTILAVVWFVGAVAVAVTDTDAPTAVRWTRLTAEAVGALLLSGVARTGAKPRPDRPASREVTILAIAVGAFVVALGVVAAVVGRAAGVDVSDQILFNTAVAIAYVLTVRSRPCA
ncbi:hypothetical protein AB0M43_35000 [Longispora sp. NPDC051575]|uniref:hypothetical protein n=1 Tax=Longispora sp. NPDC051575 TaxID=3154943 RepID=UPI00343C5BB0